MLLQDKSNLTASRTPNSFPPQTGFSIFTHCLSTLHRLLCPAAGSEAASTLSECASEWSRENMPCSAPALCVLIAGKGLMAAIRMVVGLGETPKNSRNEQGRECFQNGTP